MFRALKQTVQNLSSATHSYAVTFIRKHAKFGWKLLWYLHINHQSNGVWWTAYPSTFIQMSIACNNTTIAWLADGVIISELKTYVRAHEGFCDNGPHSFITYIKIVIYWTIQINFIQKKLSMETIRKLCFIYTRRCILNSARLYVSGKLTVTCWKT